MKVKLFDQAGNVVAEVDEDTLRDLKRKNVMHDGEHLRVPMTLLDGKKVQEPPPPFQYADRRNQSLPIDDAERARRQQQVADYNDRISSAWKSLHPGGYQGE